MTAFINDVEINALMQQRENINLAIENLLRKELELKGHLISEDEIEEERMNLYFCLSEKDAKYAFLTNEYVLQSIYWLAFDEDCELVTEV